MSHKSSNTKKYSHEEDSYDRKYKSRHRSRSRSYEKYMTSDRRSKDRYRSRNCDESYGHSRSHKNRHSRSRSPERRRYYDRKNDDVKVKAGDESSNNYGRTITTSDLDIAESEYEVKSELPATQSVFKNDGSFLELFKKMQEQDSSKTVEQKKAPIIPLTGRRRGGKVLKTGIVQKVKTEQSDENNKPKDPWSIYIDEVKKYRQSSCQDEGKTRSLVK